MNAYILSLKAVKLERLAPFYKTGTSCILKSIRRLIIKETKAISSRLKSVKRFKWVSKSVIFLSSTTI